MRHTAGDRAAVPRVATRRASRRRRHHGPEMTMTDSVVAASKPASRKDPGPRSVPTVSWIIYDRYETGS